jgi:hypothetical protein
MTICAICYCQKYGTRAFVTESSAKETNASPSQRELNSMPPMMMMVGAESRTKRCSLSLSLAQSENEAKELGQFIHYIDVGAEKLRVDKFEVLRPFCRAVSQSCALYCASKLAQQPPPHTTLPPCGKTTAKYFFLKLA